METLKLTNFLQRSQTFRRSYEKNCKLSRQNIDRRTSEWPEGTVELRKYEKKSIGTWRKSG